MIKSTAWHLAIIGIFSGLLYPQSGKTQPAPQSQTITMTFEACLELIRGTAADIAQAPINIVETKDLRMVRFLFKDGSIIVTCSRGDGKAVITKSPHR